MVELVWYIMSSVYVLCIHTLSSSYMYHVIASKPGCLHSTHDYHSDVARGPWLCTPHLERSP